MNGVGASPSRHVAVGDLGSIIVSDNGRDWQQAHSGTWTTLRAVAYGNGLWAAVGDYGAILTSSDGLSWTFRSVGLFYDLTSITWGGGQFVAVGANTAILTSPDGIGWTLRTTGTQPLRAVTWGNGWFVAGGGVPPRVVNGIRVPGEPLLLVSSNGVVWNPVEAPVPGQVSCLAYGGGRFVAGTTSMCTMGSNDGQSWWVGYDAEPHSSYEIFALCYVGNRFISSYGSESAAPWSFLVSTDGMRWTSQTQTLGSLDTVGNMRSLAANTNGIVGATRGLRYWVSHPVVWSANGAEWILSNPRLPNAGTAAAFAGGRFFLSQTPGYLYPWEFRSETSYLVSTDGANWESIFVSGSESLGLPAYGNGVWVAAGRNGRVARSTNAINWVFVDASETNGLGATAFVSGRFVVTGDAGTLLTSPDGLNWTRQPVETTNALGPAVWWGGYYAVPESGTSSVFVSTDAGGWTRHPLPIEGAVLKSLLAWDEGFVALVWTNGYDPATFVLMRSENAQAWSAETVPITRVTTIATGGGKLLTFRGTGSRVVQFKNAGETNWSSAELPWVASVDGVAYDAPVSAAFGKGTFLLTHPVGFLLQSEPLIGVGPRISRLLTAVVDTPTTRVTLRASTEGSTPMRYQWRRDGANLPSADLAFLSLSAGEIMTNRITLVVENAFGSSESDAATVTWAGPATLELGPDPSALLFRGTPGARYRLEFRSEIGSATPWSSFGEFEVPSSGMPVRVKDLWLSDWWPPTQRFFRAVFSP